MTDFDAAVNEALRFLCKEGVDHDLILRVAGNFALDTRTPAERLANLIRSFRIGESAPLVGLSSRERQLLKNNASKTEVCRAIRTRLGCSLKRALEMVNGFEVTIKPEHITKTETD